MELDTNKTGGDFEIIPTGTYEARVVKIVELGLQDPLPKYAIDPVSGKRKAAKAQLAFTFELPEVRAEIDGKDVPRLIFKTISASFGNLALLPKITQSAGITGKFKTADLLGTVVGLTIKHEPNKDGVLVAKIDSIAPVSAKVAQVVAEAETEMTEFTFSNPDKALFDKLPDWMKDTIQEAKNFKGSKVEEMLFNTESSASDSVDDLEEDF